MGLAGDEEERRGGVELGAWAVVMVFVAANGNRTDSSPETAHNSLDALELHVLFWGRWGLTRQGPRRAGGGGGGGGEEGGEAD